MDAHGRMEAIFARARIAHDGADYKAVRRLASELFELARQNGDRFNMARAHNLLGNASLHASADGETAGSYYRSALEHFRAANDKRGEAVVLLNLGSLALDIHLDLQTARDHYERSLPIFEACGDELNVAVARSNLAEIARLEGDLGSALELGRLALATYRKLKDSTRIGWQLIDAAHYHLLRGEYPLAVENLRHAYLYLVAGSNPDRLAEYFEVWFYLACDVKEREIAARLYGFLERYREANDVPRLALFRPWFAPRLEMLERDVPYDELQRLKHEGEGMTLAQADGLTRGIVPAV